MSSDNTNIVYVVGMTLILVGSLLLACFTSEMLPDYIYTRDLSQITCSITNASIIGNVCCQADVTTISKCGSGYIYPCTLVTFTDDQTNTNGTLYDNYKSPVRGSAINTCSYFHCQEESYDSRLSKVNTFISTYSVGSTHSCYSGYKSTTGNTAVLTQVSQGVIIATTFISTLILIVGIILTTTMCLIAKLQKKKNTVEKKIPPSNENLRQGSAEEYDDDSDIETIGTNTTQVSVRSSTSRTPGGKSLSENNSPIHVIN